MHGVSGTEVPCALCGERETTRLYTKFKWGIERCRRCGLIYANPRAPEAAILARYSSEYFWNEYLPAVGAAGGNYDLDYQDQRHAAMLALIRRHSPNGRRLLEVGTGAGLFLKAAQRAGWDTAGLELSSEGSAFARDRLELDVRTERAEEMSFPSGILRRGGDVRRHRASLRSRRRAGSDTPRRGARRDHHRQHTELRRALALRARQRLGGAEPARTRLLLHRTHPRCDAAQIRMERRGDGAALRRAGACSRR